MKASMKFVSHSKKGLKRNRNQDKILILDTDQFYLFFVFDGVSSMPCSHKFINQFIKRLKLNLEKLHATGMNFGQILFETNFQVLKDGIVGMSTLSALLYSKLVNKTYFINIGDSRIYQFSNQFIEKVTQDDSLSEKSNVLTKCLGLQSLVMEDFKLKEIENVYNFLICTDGFYKLMLTELKEYFKTYNFKKLGNIKTKLSILQRRKNNDDSSYILIKNEI